MKKITIILLFYFVAILFAQFEQTNGPKGANISSVAEYNNEIYILTVRKNMFKQNGIGWEKYSAPANYLTDLAEFKNSLLGIGYEGISYFNQQTNSWENKLSGYCSGYCIDENNLYVFLDDTVYNSIDGRTWHQTFDSLNSPVDFNGDTLSQKLVNITSIAVHDSNFVLACFGEFSATQTGIYVSNDNGKSWYEPEGMQSFSAVNKVIYFEGAFYSASSAGLYKSTDNGATWAKFQDGFTFDTSSELVNDLILQNGQLFAAPYSPSKLFKLTGNVWEEINGISGFYYLGKVGENKISLQYADKLELFNTETNNIEELGNDLIASNCSVLALDENHAIGYTINKNADFTTDGGSNWNTIPVKVKDLIQVENNIVYTDENGISKSNFDGTSEVNLNSNLPKDYFSFISAIRYSNGNLYAGFNKIRARDHLSPVWEAGGIYRSSDMGKTWMKSSSGLPTSGSITVPISNFWILKDMIIASTLEGIYRSIDGGLSWKKFEQNLPRYGNLYRSANYENKMIFSVYRNIIYTTPEMNEWKTIETGIDSINYGYTYRFANENGKQYIFNNDDKTFYLLNDTTWEKYSVDLPAEFEVINFSSADNSVYASVVDGGIWKGKINSATSVSNKSDLPSTIKLMQNYPNPFNPSTVIRYSLPVRQAVDLYVSLIVYDILGNEVATLVNENQKAGNYEVQFNTSSAGGSNGLASGIYIYRLKVQNFTQSKKMLLLK